MSTPVILNFVSTFFERGFGTLVMSRTSTPARVGGSVDSRMSREERCIGDPSRFSFTETTAYRASSDWICTIASLIADSMTAALKPSFRNESAVGPSADTMPNRMCSVPM
jgi:hypothetical protein